MNADTLALAHMPLCDDLRWYLHQLLRCTICTRCTRIVQGRRRAAMCFVRNERLCFACYHRAQWPR